MKRRPDGRERETYTGRIREKGEEEEGVQTGRGEGKGEREKRNTWEHSDHIWVYW